MVAEAELTAEPVATPLSTCNVEPDGLENCRLAPPSAAFNCETIEAMPPETLTPITAVLGLVLEGVGNGSTEEVPTATICSCCCVLVAVLV